MARQADEITRRIAELRTAGMTYPQVCEQIEHEWPGVDCWWQRAPSNASFLSVWIEKNGQRDRVWTDEALAA